ELAASLPEDLADRARRERNSLAARGVDAATATAEARYRMVDAVVAEVVRAPLASLSWRERLDRVLTHRVSGTLILLGLFTLVFQALFAWSGPLMDGVGALFGLLGDGVAAAVPEGLLREFLVDGLVAGFEGVVVFVPQIAILFVFIEVMDDSGYLARAAFLLDRLMGKAGLPGRAFLPLVSGFACAIPGIMAARTIKDPRDRMATIFTVPFMSCSARLPVYTMVVGALFSEGRVFGFLATGTVIMISMYLLGIAAGLLSAGLLRRTVLRGGRSPLLLELPGYRWPQPRSVLLEVGRRTWQFVSRAGPVIVVLTVVLWVLAAFPREVDLDRDYDALRAEAAAAAGVAPDAPPEAWTEGLRAEMVRIDDMEGAERSARSWAGRIGRTMEPVLAPLGFDWKIGIGIVASFAAREVFVSTLAVVYAAGDAGEEDEALLSRIRSDVDPGTGRPVFRPLVGISLLVFFVLAMQCMSTLAVVRRETGGWKWPLLMLGWMTGLAYVGSLLVYQVGSALGF
ncbi:MAG: ferrous iron transporter B, partial [Planctomycetaceae bacterium]|nr:ferrous iron transporter B [Planctomycetaceae bacterium]